MHPAYLLLGISLLLHAQSAPVQQFEVASVRPAAAAATGARGMRGGPGTADPERMTWSRATIQALLISAYGVKADQISAPGWIESERYDIEAKVPPGATKAQFNLMLQNLLADRFKLTLHKDTKEFSVYELTVAKGWSKAEAILRTTRTTSLSLKERPAQQWRWIKMAFPILMPGQRQAGRWGNGITRSTYRKYSMSDLVTALEPMMNMATGTSVFEPVHVMDSTGITGQYDFKLEFAGEMVLPGRAAQGTPADPGSAGPSLFTALEKQLGLKLEHSKQPLEVLIIDRVEKTPTEN